MSISEADQIEFENCKKRAQDGDAEAQCLLGTLYFCGRGVERSYDEAVRWYFAAFKNGSVAAGTNLEMCRDTGKGTVPDEYYKIKDEMEASRFALEKDDTSVWLRETTKNGETSFVVCPDRSRGVIQFVASAALSLLTWVLGVSLSGVVSGIMFFCFAFIALFAFYSLFPALRDAFGQKMYSFVITPSVVLLKDKADFGYPDKLDRRFVSTIIREQGDGWMNENTQRDGVTGATADAAFATSAKRNNNVSLNYKGSEIVLASGLDIKQADFLFDRVDRVLNA